MRIKRLDLKAYGHFTDCTLDFNSDTPGLHIIYGPNEAGKSTALRALQGLLYGIPMRTADNFLHDYNKLLIGGCLENSDGNELTFWRRKKNVGDLLDSDLNIIDQGVLAEFLHGIEEPLFNTLFGIDHESLVSGGRDILEQKGDIGQALFSAGAGLSSLHGIIEAMEKECDGLFKGGGSRPELNQAIKSYQEIKKEIRTLSLSSSAWKEQKDILDSATRDLDEIESQKRSLGSELEQLKRLQRSIPNLIKRVTLQNKLEALGNLDHLPPDFSDRLQEALAERKQVEKSLQDSRSRMERLEEKKDLSTLRQDVLDQAETIDALHQRLGGQQQAQNDRPKIHGEFLKHRAEAEALLNQVAPALDLTQIDEIKSLLARRPRILTLGNRFAGLEHGVDQAENQVDSLADSLKKVEDDLEFLPEVGELSGLASAVTAAQKSGDIDGTLRNLDRDIRLLTSNAEADLKRIGLWSGSLEELLTLPLPSSATIDKFVEDFREAAEEGRSIQQRQKEFQDELDRVGRDLKVIEKTGAVPTEDDLVTARDRRDQGWQLVKRVWLDKEELEEEIRTYDESQDLPSAFETGMRTADEVADHLRSAAERVHQYASLLVDSEKLEGQLQRLGEGADCVRERQEQLESEWQEVWQVCKIAPQSPREMRSWAEQCRDIIKNLQEAKQKEAEKQPHLEQRKNLRDALFVELKSVGKDKAFPTDELSSALSYSENILSELEGIQDQYQTFQKEKSRISKELLSAKEALKKSQQAMDAWRAEWALDLEGFILPEDARPDEAAEALDILRNCLDKIVKVNEHEQRIEEIDRNEREFETSVAALVRSIAPELEELPPGQSVVKLEAMLKEAEKTKSIQEKLDEDIESAEEEIRQAKVAQQGVEAEMTSLQELARCDSDGALIEIETRFREQHEAKKELESLEETLLGIAEGISLDELEKQRQAADPNELPGQIESLDRQIEEELSPRIKELSGTMGEARNELQKMDGGGEAAAKEDAAQQALAKVRRLADRYLRVRLGSQVLKKEIERYRQENQDPILRMASRYFSELTLDAFPGLRSDLDDNGNPILVGVCPDGSRKTVEEMSSGTRDQLYLALRLATLEWRLEKHEPMPFIADDILVNFDDGRAEATLKALAELAKANQVILFTHHQQIVRTVESLGMDDHVLIHPIGPSTATMQ